MMITALFGAMACYSPASTARGGRSFSRRRFLASGLLLVLAQLAPATAAAQENDGNNLFSRQWGAAADNDDPAWQYRQGRKYDSGQGVEQDKAAALDWYRKSADRGYPQAQLLLGILYDQGVGVPQDYAQAAVWYRKAAEQGYAKAQYNLAGLYDAGQGVEQDGRQAAEWYRRAAEQGYARAQFNLGAMYLGGEGVESSPVQGYMWLQLAAARGLADKVEALLAQTPPLSRAELKKARRLAAEWQAGHAAGNPAAGEE